MPILVLVTGLGEDSGKTILAASLTGALRGLGVGAVAFKPHAAGRVWGGPSLEYSMENGFIVTGDAVLLDRASGGVLGLEATAPVSVLTSPWDPERHGWRPPHSDLVLAGRVSACRGGRVETLHFYNVEDLERAPPGVRDALVDLAGRLHPRPLRAGRELAERLLEGQFIPEAESCLAHALERAQVVVVESNSDVAAPTPSSLQAALVLVAAWTRVAVVPGDRWRRAVEVLAGTLPHRLGAGEVLRLAGASQVYSLPLLRDPLEGYRPRDLEPILSLVQASLEEGRA